MIVNNLDLDIAVADGIISRDQAIRLGNLVARDLAAGDKPIDFTQDTRDEPFRLLRGFRDAFVAIGVVIFAIGLTALAAKFTGAFTNAFSARGNFAGFSVLTIFVTALLCVFGLVKAEIITRRLRLPLSSLVVSIVFAIWSALLFASIAVFFNHATTHTGSQALRVSIANVGWHAAAGAVAGTIFFYWRYRLPFALFLLAGSSVGLSLLIVNNLTGGTGFKDYGRLLIGLWGVGIFFAAMWFDIKDRLRVTRLSECAFWLHIFAAPMVVHSLLRGDTYETSRVGIVLGAMAILTVIALLIDRRALLVSGLGYFAAALSQLVSGSEVFFAQQFAFTAFLLGSIVLTLGIGWTAIRRGLLSILPLDRLKSLLPPAAV